MAIAAGNSGSVGSWYASSGSTGIDVLSVASIDNEQLYVASATATIAGKKISMVRFFPYCALNMKGTRLMDM